MKMNTRATVAAGERKPYESCQPVAVVFMPGMAAHGGAERYAASLAGTLAGLGYDVTLATTGLDSLDGVATYFGVDLTNVRLLKLRSVDGFPGRTPTAVKELLRDLIWFRQVSALNPAIAFNTWYKSELSIPGTRNVYVCHFPHGLGVPRRGLRRPYLAAVRQLREALLGRFPDNQTSIVSNSVFTADNVRLRWKRRADVIFPPCPPMGWDKRDSKGRRIIAVGRYVEPEPHIPNKRFDILVDAFRQAVDLHEAGWTLQIVGSCGPSDRDYVRRLKGAAGVAPISLHTNVNFDELSKLYRGSAVYWHAQGFGESVRHYPEAQEHFGMSTVEAMSAGCIPIVYGTAGPKEVVDGSPGGATWSSVAELLSQTRRIASMPESELRLLADLNMARAAEFDIDSFRDRLAAFLANSRQLNGGCDEL